MRNAVLVLAVGPVQGFIQAARRTADLFQGSAILSDLVRAAAEAFQPPNARLVFPGDCTGPVSNKVVALVPEGEAEHVAKMARAAVWDRWRQRVAEVVGSLNDRWPAWREYVDEDFLLSQADPEDWIEVYVAWAFTASDEAAHYADALSRAERTLAGRKSLRDFRSRTGAPAPKSWLDAGRETVFQGFTAEERRQAVATLATAFAHRSLVRPSEQLDGVSLIKRLLPLTDGDEAFPSLDHVAARPALDAWWAAHKDQHAQVTQLVDEIRKTCDLRRYGPGYTKGNGLREIDPEWLEADSVQDRYASLFEEEHRDRARQRVSGLADRLSDLKLSIPHYVVVLMADGDHMGQWIRGLANNRGVAAHREASMAVGRFSRAIEEGLSRRDGAGVVDGDCVYAGGDEVLGLVPVARTLLAVACVDRLFRELVATPLGGQDAPSISIGVAVVHVKTVFEEARQLASRALRAAKGVRASAVADGAPAVGHTAILLSKRAGEDLLVAGDTSWLAGTLEGLVHLFADEELPGKLPYELSEALGPLPWRQVVDRGAGHERFEDTLGAAEIRRILKRKRSQEGVALSGEAIDAVEKLFARVSGTASTWEAGSWRGAIDLLLVSRSLAAMARPEHRQ